MLEYRVYIIGKDGHFSHRYEFRCATDDDAWNLARKLLNGHDIELWQLGRKVNAFSVKENET